MTSLIALVLSQGLTGTALVAQDSISPASQLDANKALAAAFYQDLWLSNNTDRVTEYVAETYIIHDLGEEKNVRQPAERQKEIADFFWANGDMTGEIDYQIADADLVATRWRLQYAPTTLLGRIVMGEMELPIINVFRIRDGKIVEIWNHRHDIETGMTLRFTIQGFLMGLLVAVVPTIWAMRLRKRLREVTA